MALVRPFRALRPKPDAARAVSAVPYDVVSTNEARSLAAGNPLSFLHVSRAEINLPPHTDPYADVVYETASANLDRLIRDAPLVVEQTPSLYLYRLRTADHEQTGLAGCYSLDEYDRSEIRQHERTRPDKENDRTRHLLALHAQTGVVFLTFRAMAETAAIMQQVRCNDPLFDIETPDGVCHTIWRLNPDDQIAAVAAFDHVGVLYIADGHHRIASAARARDQLVSSGGDNLDMESQFVLGVAFPDSEMRIQAYNRVLTDLAGQTPEQFLEAVRTQFEVRGNANPIPSKGHVSMYLKGSWYDVDLSLSIAPDESRCEVDHLDVAVLQEQLLQPMLKVRDIRTDSRVTFVGGVRGTDELARLVNTGKAAVAFSLAPVTTEELFAVSDAGDIMPPKSTWFEPKLRDGLLIHQV